MMETARSLPSDSISQADWKAALHGDRAAFQAVMAPCLRELFEAAGRELRYRVALGDLSAGDLTADELVGEVLVRAWRDRHRRPSGLGLRAWLLALLFRVLKHIVRREARFRKLAEVSLEAPPPPEPFYDDDESFWEWYQPDEVTRWEELVHKPASTPEELTAADEEFTRSLDPRTREVLLLSDLHRIELPEIALARGLSLSEAARRLVEARRRVGMEADRNLP
jgi:DNA-directed RNA polymerase specialized sigma24 family protein